jgi:uncharacterized membrane protein
MGTTLVSGEDRTLHLEILHVPLLQPFRWIGRGWRDMRRHRGASLGYGALIVALGWTLLVFGATHPYFVAAAITGFLLVGPAMSAGLCELSRRDSLGQAANFDTSLEGFVRNAHALVEFGVILAVFAVGWFVLSAILLGSVFHIAAPSVTETMYRGFIDSANRAQVLGYIGAGGVLAALVFAISVIAIPLIIDRQATATNAMLASVKAAFANIPAMIVWSALILILTVIGYAPLLFGLLIVAPLLGHATWHAYRDLVR